LRVATTFSLQKLSLLCWPARFYGGIKIKRRSKMTSCLIWLPLKDSNLGPSD
jgi:hypothetical protein